MLKELAAEELETLVNGLVDAWNSHDIERVVAFYSPSYRGTDLAEAEQQVGPDGVRRTLGRYYGAFPDLRFSRDEVLVQGNRVALSWIGHGTHLGSLMNIPPTRRPIEIRGVSLLTVELTPEGPRVSRATHVSDLAGLLRRLGLLPEL